MPRFRKKPVDVEAVQVSPEWLDNLAPWLKRVVDHAETYSSAYMDDALSLYFVKCGDQRLCVEDGQWVVKCGSDLRVLSDDIFRATYEPVED